MASVAPAPERWTSEEYFALVAAGQLGPDDRVELLEGVVVSMSPHTPRHAGCIQALTHALIRVVGERGSVRVQLSLLAGSYSVPEPDLAVVPGSPADYSTRHPDAALLVVEVADSSLVQDRLTKGAMYAAAGFPEYWLVNLVDDRIEVFRSPDRKARRYRETRIARRGETLEVQALPGAMIAVGEVLPVAEA